MIKSIVKITARIFILITIVCSILVVLTKTTSIDTNMLSLIDSGTLPIKELFSKNSQSINIVFKSSRLEEAIELSNNFYSKLDPKKFDLIRFNNLMSEEDKIFQTLNSHRSSLISDSDYKNLCSSNYDYFLSNSIKQISSSFTPSLISFLKDPFFIFSNYLKSIVKPQGCWNINEGYISCYKDELYYILMNLVVKKDHNEYIQNLLDIKDSMGPDSSSIYISGPAVHSYLAMKNTSSEINFLTLISVLAVLILSMILLRSFRYIIIIAVNIGLSILVAYSSLVLSFKSLHVLTFLFATSLIGLSIDYSFHYMSSSSKDLKLVKKNMSQAFLTTLVCFVPLFFSGIDLLKQICVFVCVGLGFNFLSVWFIYPMFNSLKKELNTSKVEGINKNLFNFNFGFKYFNFKTAKILSIILVIIFILPLLFKTKIKTDLGSLYTPSKDLKQADSLMNNLSMSGSSYLLINWGSSTQEVLENEEALKKEHDFFSLSSIVPSLKKQKEVSKLLDGLYKSTIPSLVLSLGIKNKFYVEKTSFLTVDLIPELSSSYLIKTNKLYYSISPLLEKIPTNSKSTIINTLSFLNDTLDTLSYNIYKILYFCVGILLVVLLILYRSKFIYYIVPSLFSIISTLGIIALTGVNINLFHLLSLFIVIGVGIDYTIFILSSNFKKSILFSFLSTCIGFLLLSFTSFKIISSMGLVLGMGLCFSFFYSILWRFKNEKQCK